MKKIIPFFFFISLATINLLGQTDSLSIDLFEFQIGYPDSKQNAPLSQLISYPTPRYIPNSSIIRNFNWMNPNYLGGSGQENIKGIDAISNAVEIQKELAFHWNYSFVIQNSTMAYGEEAYQNKNVALNAFTNLANEYPNIPLGVIVMWKQMKPSMLGIKNNPLNVISTELSDAFYIIDKSKQFKRKMLSFAAPDSIFIEDGQLQKKYLENIIKHLTRPINMINENGEEQPVIVQESVWDADPRMTEEKNRMKINSWKEYTSIKKNQFRKLYADQFMKHIPELKNTWFSYYQVDGGPSAYQYDWNISKTIGTKINGNYYSTPDLYPQFPKNWMLTSGPWHGWNWIEIARKTEIKSGDKFFSPFIAAGWAYNPESDIRPAQWLGLLKCTNVVGAEFFYTAYFNLEKPFARPENYIWQAAIPSYAQAIVTHYNDIFRNGNVLLDKKGEPIITYPTLENDKDVLVTVRKHDSKKQYVIAATVQTKSNKRRTPLQKSLIINIDGDYLEIEARRQGSVYIYDKTAEPAIFYQLDRWHQASHPERWRKEWVNEAEVFDSASTPSNQLIKSALTKNADTMIVTNVLSFVSLNKNEWVKYSIANRDLEHLKSDKYVHLLVKSKKRIKIIFSFNTNTCKIKGKKTNTWKWLTLKLPDSNKTATELNSIHFLSKKKNVLIDKIIVSDSEQLPELKDY